MDNRMSEREGSFARRDPRKKSLSSSSIVLLSSFWACISSVSGRFCPKAQSCSQSGQTSSLLANKNHNLEMSTFYLCKGSFTVPCLTFLTWALSISVWSTDILRPVRISNLLLPLLFILLQDIEELFEPLLLLSIVFEQPLYRVFAVALPCCRSAWMRPCWWEVWMLEACERKAGTADRTLGVTSRAALSQVRRELTIVSAIKEQAIKIKAQAIKLGSTTTQPAV